jgi:hypothetical protein
MSTKAQREKVRAFLAEVPAQAVIEVLAADCGFTEPNRPLPHGPAHEIVQHFTDYGGHLLAEARRNAARARHEQTRPCEHCGNAYVASRTDTRYCSPRCRVAAHRARVTPTSPENDGAVTP